MVEMTESEWMAAGEERYGKDTLKWRFRCPVCKFVVTPEDYRSAGAPDTAIAFSCVGRWKGDSSDAFKPEGKGPCNYAGGGLFRLNPITVTAADSTHHVFDFADRPLAEVA